MNQSNFQRDKIVGKRFERLFQVQRSTIDLTARTAWLSIASDAPYERYWGVEVLDMDSGSIRQGRLRSGAPLLVGHDTADQVGVIDSYEIADKKLRVLARFGRSVRAEEIFRDVVDGIRRNASVGYIIHDLHLEKQEEDVNTYRVTDWEPLEGSLVPVPADTSVGVGRWLDTTQSKGRTMDENTSADAGVAAADDYSKQIASTPKAELADALRIKDLFAAGSAYRDMGGEEIARELIASPHGDIATFKRLVYERLRGASKPLATATAAPAHAHWGSGARVGYSHGKLRAFDNEENAHRAGMWIRATVLGDRNAQDWCNSNGVRAMQEGTLGDGGATVPIEMASAFIRLVEAYGMFRQNARIWPMNSDTLKIARRKTGLSVFLLGENAAAQEAQQGWDDVTLSTKKFGTLVRVSNELLEDSAIALADAIIMDIALAFATQEDQCGFTGDGTSTYGGMYGLTQILIDANHTAGKVAAATGHHVFTAIDNVDLTTLMSAVPWYARKNAKWYCSSTAWDQMFSRLMAIAGGNRLDNLSQAPQHAYLGHEVVISQTMPMGSGTDYTGKVMALFGDLSLSSAMGMRRGLTVRADPSRYLEYDQIGFMCTERFDIVNHSCGSTSAAGPVVGLVGA